MRKKRPNLLQREYGFSLIEIMVGLAVTLILMMGITMLLLMFGRQRYQMQIRSSAGLLRLQILGNIQSNSIWQTTMADPANSNMACLLNRTVCATGGNFKLVGVGGATIYDGTSASSGITSDGNLCNTYSVAPGDDNCPLHLNLSWIPLCGPTQCSQVKIIGDFVYSPQTSTNKFPFNTDNYHMEVIQSVATAAASVVYSGVAVGLSHSCAIVSGGIKCWADNFAGQLGDGTLNSSLIPVVVPSIGSGATSVGAGDYFTCAIVNGGVQCWGFGGTGQLGNGMSANSSNPVVVNILTSGVTGLSVGKWHSCAIMGGGAWCWGLNQFGQVGNTTIDTFLPNNRSNVPLPVQGLGTNVTNISAGERMSCAVMSGEAWCWGTPNTAIGASLGVTPVVTSLIPVKVQGLSVGGVSAVSVGKDHICAIDNGAVYCWGSNNAGQLGLGSNLPAQSDLPLAASGLSAGVTAISAATYANCALASGVMKCWGFNGNGGLGIGSYSGTNLPGPVLSLSGVVSAIFAGSARACAIVTGGVQCWGSNAFGQIGDGTTIERTLPVSVNGL